MDRDRKQSILVFSILWVESSILFNYEFNQPVVVALATAAATLSPIETTGVFPSHTVVGNLKISLKLILRITAITCYIG